MTWLVTIGLSNAVLATLLAGAALTAGRWLRAALRLLKPGAVRERQLDLLSESAAAFICGIGGSCAAFGSTGAGGLSAGMVAV